MAKFKKTTFGELEEGFKIKYPARGKDARIGTVCDIQRAKKETAILVRWDDNGHVSQACKPDNYEITAKEDK